MPMDYKPAIKYDDTVPSEITNSIALVYYILLVVPVIYHIAAMVICIYLCNSDSILKWGCGCVCYTSGTN